MSHSRGGGSKRNVAFIQGDEPKFLQEFKQRAGYLAGPALEEKFLRGKIPKKKEDDDDESGSESPASEEEVDRKRSRRDRGFSPTSRFPEEPDAAAKSSPDVERADEKPMVVDKEGKEVAKETTHEEEDDTAELDHAGQLKSGGSQMNRTLDVVYGKSQVKSKPLVKGVETADVDKIVASGGKFMFKKRNAPRQEEKVDDVEEDSEAPSTAAATRKWRQEQGESTYSAQTKKKSESRAVADRKLLSFDVDD